MAELTVTVVAARSPMIVLFMIQLAIGTISKIRA
jgi:hypothetical protein